MLKACGESSIVIERKSIVWPPGNEYLADHHKSHQLLEDFVRRLKQRGNPFAESAYQLVVNDRDLKGKGKKEVTRIAEQIADVVWSNEPNVKSQSGIGKRDPIL